MKQKENLQNKVFSYTFGSGDYKTTVEVKLSFDCYESNGSLAVILMRRPYQDEIDFFGIPEDKANEFSEEFARITINLPKSILLSPDTQFVDSNNLSGIEKWLVENKIAKRTSVKSHSSFCTYTAFKFNLPEDFIKKIKEEGSVS